MSMIRISTVTLIALLSCFGAMSVMAGDPVKKTVEELHKEKAELKGKQVQLQGKVVKVNNQILNRNFLHIQDGSGENETSDLTVTSQETAEMGQEVIVTGTVVIDHDFGAGYVYPLILENATITKATK